MTKQEFLAMNLPYNVRIYWRDNEVVFLDTKNIRVIFDMIDWVSIKPILHPLSDLTKEIEHKGEKFVPYKKLDWRKLDGEIGEYISFGDCHAGLINPLDQLSQLQLLLSWHFDIADLISKGEAIDVNTLETNPYK